MRDEDTKEVVKGLGIYEDLKASSVEAESTKDVGQRGQNLTGHRDLGGKGEEGGRELSSHY